MAFDPTFDVSGKIVVISGGLGILGMNFVNGLVERDALVAVFDLPIESNVLQKKIDQVSNQNNFMFVEASVVDKESVKKGLSLVEKTWGTPFGLINSAALDSPPDSTTEDSKEFENFPESSWDRIMDVNVKGAMNMCQVLGKAMVEKGTGSIINIGSIYGIVSPDQRIYKYKEKKEGKPFYKPVAYSVSKSAILNLTRYLATYWGEKGIRVNTLSFGGVYDNQDREFLEEYCKKVPIARMARKDEYNGAVIFLLSPASSYMTGSNIVIDGGLTAW